MTLEAREKKLMVPYLWRDDGERFTRNEDGTYSMDKNREAQPTSFYRYTYGYLMNTGCFSVYPPNKPTEKLGSAAIARLDNKA